MKSITFLGCLSSVCPLTPILHEATSVPGEGDFNQTWHKYSSREWALLKKFLGQRSKVKVIARPNALSGRRIAINFSEVIDHVSSEGIPIDSVVLRLTCFYFCYLQVAQLSQRHCAAGWVSYGQK